MKFLLPTLKVLGVAVAGILGVFGYFKETRDKKGRLTSFARYAAILTALGLIIAIAAELIDEHDQSKQAEATAIQQSDATDRLIGATNLINSLLTQVADLKTQNQRSDSYLDSISVSFLNYELPENDENVIALKDFCRSCVSDPDDLIGFTNVYHYDPNASYTDNGDPRGETDRFESNDYGSLAAATTNRLMKSFLLTLGQTRFRVGFSKKLLIESDYAGPLFTVTNGIELFNVSATNLIFTGPYDLTLSPKRSARGCVLHYSLPSNRIFLRFSGVFPKNKWLSNQDITSIYDIGSSYCSVEMIPDLIESFDKFKCLRDLQFVSCSLYLSSHGSAYMLPLASNTNLDNGKGSAIIVARLPSEHDIYNGPIPIISSYP